MKAFTTYIAFLSKGVPVGAQVEGAAVLQSVVPNRRADAQAGSVVDVGKCKADMAASKARAPAESAWLDPPNDCCWSKGTG